MIMGRNLFSTEEILKLPVTTNKLSVTWDGGALFKKYSIVSYSMKSRDKDRKNLSYEQLSDTPAVSVAGFWAKYGQYEQGCTKFFVLVRRGDEKKVLESLGKQEDVAMRLDDLSDYSEYLQKRIIASLAVNSLGKHGKNGMMYNNGQLLVCDDNNFGIPASRQELVCLKLEVNQYMNLSAKTVSFSHPKTFEDLKRRNNCVFKIGKEMDGTLWLGKPLCPFVVKQGKENVYNLDELYIQQKRFKATRNVVPYWPFDSKKYNHGKLFVIRQVVDLVNEKFENLLKLSFTDYDVLDFQEGSPENKMLKMLAEYFKDKVIGFEDPFKTPASKKQIALLKNCMKEGIGNSLAFAKRGQAPDVVVGLCQPEDDTEYSKSKYGSSIAIQHLVHSGNEKQDKVIKSVAIRILMELMVKDCNIHCQMPPAIGEMMEDWTFYSFKSNKDVAHGGSLSADIETGNLLLKAYGFSDKQGVDFDTFVSNTIGYGPTSRIKGFRDYKVMAKDGNMYLIVDTEEIPILDASYIDEVYARYLDEDDKEIPTLSVFKRKANGCNHWYLRGYMGFHLWRAEGLNGEGAYSYISGNNSHRIQFIASQKIDKMPRVRRIFILEKKHPDRVWNDIQQLKVMLLVGFGRWGEQMTYPFPFKFLQEYLDKESKETYEKHWSKL